MRIAVRLAPVLLVGCALGPWWPCQSVLAQAAPTSTAAPAAAGAEESAALASADDLRSLVAPVALFPDPILSAILQASTVPLQVVEAQRFLVKLRTDPLAKPKEGWDPSVVALLNYPQMVEAMSDHLDWMQSVGDAVVDQLSDLQEAIQGIRWSAYTKKILASNDAQRVTVDDNVVQILPIGSDTVRIPQYDPAALLAAIDAPVAPPPPAPLAPPSEAATTAPAAPAAQAAPAPTSPPPVASLAPAPVYEVAPAYVAPPVATAPIVTYAEPTSSFWSNTASFVGGAALGGLLGYMIGNDNNNNNGGHHNNYYYGNGGYWNGNRPPNWNGNNNWKGGGHNKINIEGNTVIIANNDRLQQQLRRDRPAGQVRPAKASPGRQIAAVPVTRPAGGLGEGQTRPGRDQPVRQKPVAVPSFGGQRPPGAQATRPQPAVSRPAPERAVAQGKTRPVASPGMTGDLGSKRKVEAQQDRGSRSRAAASPARAAPVPKVMRQDRGGGGGGGMSFGDGGGKRDAGGRGAKSRGDGHGGGGRGR